MSEMARALFKAGLISQAQLEAAQSQPQPTGAELAKQFRGAAQKADDLADQIRKAATLNEFRETARKLLAIRPEMVDWVTNLIHKMKAGWPKEKAHELIFRLNKLRQQLDFCNTFEQKQRAVEQTLSRHGWKLGEVDAPTAKKKRRK